MLIAKIFVNEKQIDEIHVQNIAQDKLYPHIYYYKIRKPDLGATIISHVRRSGYLPLLKRVLDAIIKNTAKG